MSYSYDDNGNLPVDPERNVGAPRRARSAPSRFAHLLAPGEGIEREAEAYCKKGLLVELFGGRVCLTNERLIWLRRSAWLVGILFIWSPRSLSVPLRTMSHVALHREPWSTWIRIRSEDRDYAFRMGKGPYPFLRDRARVTADWYDAIELARARL